MNKQIEPEYESKIADIKSKLWQSFNILRGSLSIDEYYVLLYLISVFNEQGNLNIIVKTDETLDVWIPKNDLSCVDFAPETERLKKLYSLYDFFKPSLEKLNDRIISEIHVIFQSFETVILKEYFSEIFDFILFKISKNLGRMSGEHIQPIEFAKFVCGLIDLENPSRVYNPFAGYVSFGIYLPETVFYWGQESNYSTWVIGSLRILAYNREGRFIYLNESSLQEWGMRMHPTGDGNFDQNLLKHDLIISSPPFGMRLEHQEGKFGPIKTAEHFVIEKGIEEINPTGKLVTVLSQGFLFRAGSEQNLRQFLIENDLIDLVISLPGGLLLNTMIPTIILVINKNKEKKFKDVVRFVDGNDFVKKQSGKFKTLAGDELMGIISSGDYDDAIRFVPNENIAINEYNLSVRRYFQKPFEGVELKELFTAIRGRRNTDTIGQIIRIKDLKGDKFNYKFEVGVIDDLEIPHAEQEISESCLLIASVGDKLKPTYFNYTGTPIYISPNIFIFQVDEQKIDLDYLVNELYTDSTTDQLRSILVGSAMPRLKRDDFLAIKIDLPNLSEQKAKVKGLKEEHMKSREKELILERELLGLKDEAFREFASIKHTFRQYLNALKSNVSGTRKFISNNIDQNISLKSIYSRNLNRTLGEHLISLEGTIDSMSKLLTSVEEQAPLVKPVEVSLEELIEEAQNRFTNLEIFQFEKLSIDWESFAIGDTGDYIGPNVYIDPEDFFRVFSNVISNAVGHGFKNRNNNIIRTSLSFDPENSLCILEISNNGNPMNKDFTLKHLTTRGEKTSDSEGSGVGGSDIKSILEKYNGTLDLRKDESAEFPVTYVIGLPLVVGNF